VKALAKRPKGGGRFVRERVQMRKGGGRSVKRAENSPKIGGGARRKGSLPGKEDIQEGLLQRGYPRRDGRV
jgi:hypothetical protein